jgi:hypothetical protein
VSHHSRRRFATGMAKVVGAATFGAFTVLNRSPAQVEPQLHSCLTGCEQIKFPCSVCNGYRRRCQCQCYACKQSGELCEVFNCGNCTRDDRCY